MWFFLLHWIFYVPKTIHTKFYGNRLTGTRFFRRIKSLCFWLLGDSTLEVYYRTVYFTATLLKKCFKAYFSPISTIICRKTRIKVNFKFHFCLLLGDAQCGEGLLPHFWKVRLKTSRANFDQFFHGYFEEEKKRNTFDRYLVGNKWIYEKIEEKNCGIRHPLCYPF